MPNKKTTNNQENGNIRHPELTVGEHLDKLKAQAANMAAKIEEHLDELPQTSTGLISWKDILNGLTYFPDLSEQHDSEEQHCEKLIEKIKMLMEKAEICIQQYPSSEVAQLIEIPTWSKIAQEAETWLKQKKYLANNPPIINRQRPEVDAAPGTRITWDGPSREEPEPEPSSSPGQPWKWDNNQ